MANLPSSPTVARGASFGVAETPGVLAFLAIVGGLTVVRLIGLRFSVVDLYIDESQYWSWSRDLAFGYYSKPPLIAWVIAAAGAVCGTGEACVRAPAPIFYFGTAVLVYAIGFRLYGGRTAFYAGLAAALAPGIAFSARIISTDVPLLFFWALALFAWVQLVCGGSRWWAAVLAVAFGLGALSKYAMVYFVPCTVMAGFIEPRARRLLAKPLVWTAFAAGALFLVPNLVWNLDHGMATMAATGTNIAGPGLAFQVTNALEFVAAQFAIVGPIVFAALLYAAAHVFAPSVTPDDRLMLAFSVPILAAITAVAVVTDANANWAAPAAVSAFVVATAVLVRAGRMGFVIAGLAVGAACQVAFIVADRYADHIAMSPYARTMGWRAFGEEVSRIAGERGARSIVTDGRGDVASLIYYAGGDRPIYAWPPAGAPVDHFELTRPLPADAAEPLLAVDACDEPSRFTAQFGSVEPVGTIAVQAGATRTRSHVVYLLADRRAPPAALEPCPR